MKDYHPYGRVVMEPQTTSLGVDFMRQHDTIDIAPARSWGTDSIGFVTTRGRTDSIGFVTGRTRGADTPSSPSSTTNLGLHH